MATSSPPLTAMLRAEVSHFIAAAGTRRVLPAQLHIGTPGGHRLTVAHDSSYDAGLRADLIERMIDGLEAGSLSCSWITRSGPMAPGDADFAWSAAARAAFGRYGISYPGFFVITRGGWLHLETGQAVAHQPVRRRRRTA